MKCPKCQFENREGVKFCEECGTKFELECPACKANIPLGRKFCGECGHNFTISSEPLHKELSFDEKLDKIQRYLPKGLTEKILAQRERIEGERKQVTVMFCDMEGFTRLSEKLGPEEAYGIMDKVYEILIHKVHDYEGTVNEMTGDGIMALFGAPIALEDAPQRAIRSSLAIHREMSKFSDKIKQEREGIPPLKMRVGIHTGPVVVGTLGNDLRVEFKAVGDTVNIASRMEGLAQPGTTYVTEDTFRATEGFFRFEALGEREVKGKAEPVKTFQVIAPSTSRTRFDVSADRGLTPFVGRERELELLLDGFDRAKGGRGQAFSIVAEAGVGKSRLLYEFRKAMSGEDVTFLEGKCLSYSSGVAYHLHIDTLKANFDIREGDGDSEIREKVEKGLKKLGAEEVSDLPYFLELLSVKDSGIDEIAISPEAKKRQTIEALKRIVLKGSEIRLLILAYEDLHWVDKSSEEVLKNILESIPGARVLLIFTYRPEFVHTWGGKSYHSQANLNRLSNRESLAMVAHLLGTDQIESDLENFILEKTEGIPFFIEEFIKSLRDLQIIERKDSVYRIAKDIKTLTIPSTIQDVIMARVDSLPEGARGVLQTGSVVGREFSHDLINRVMERPEQELLSHLSVLKDSELVYERGIYPQSTYIFKHALTQEVAYNSLLLKRRKEVHEKIGGAIETLCSGQPQRLEDVATLGHHFSLSNDTAKGAHYLVVAGDWARDIYANDDAIRHYERAFNTLSACASCEVDQLLVQERLGDLYGLIGRRETALAHYEAVLRACETVEDRPGEARMQRKIGGLQWDAGDRDRALKCFELGLTCLDDRDESIELAHLYQEMGRIAFRGGDNSRAVEWAERALAQAERLAARVDEPLTSPDPEAGQEVAAAIAHASNTLGVALARMGRLDEAVACIERSRTVAEKAGLLQIACRSSANLGVLYRDLEPSRAIDTCLHGLEVAKKIGDLGFQSRLYANLSVAYCTLTNRCDEQSIGAAQAAIDLDRRLGRLDHLAVPLIVLGQLYQCHGELDLAFSHYREALSLAEESGEPQLLFPCYEGLATLYLERDDEAQAEQYMRKAQLVCERSGLDPDSLVVLSFLD